MYIFHLLLERQSVKAFRRQIVIIFSAYNIETMAKRFKTIKEVDLEEPRSGKGARCPTMQSVVQRPKPHAGEMIICGLLILLLMTGTYWRNRVWNSELELWTDCVKKSPYKDRPHNNLGSAFLDQGRYQEAANQFNEALRINPNYTEAHYNLGSAFLDQGRYQEATNQFNEALRINPNFAEAHNNLGNVFLNQGKYQGATNQYSEALRINPNYPEAHNNLGNVLLDQGRYQEATNQYNEALRINPKFVEAHYNLGKAYLMIGDRGLVLKEYEILKTLNRGLANDLYQEIK